MLILSCLRLSAHPHFHVSSSMGIFVAMKLDALIVDLLFEHDCVILPDFGGFVANYRNARLNPITHVISPPSRQIGFNPHIAHNDGLLVHAVSKKEQIGYQDAELIVRQWLGDAKKTLNSGGRLNLPRVGILFQDKSGNVQFIPDEQDNFLLDSFGLPSVQLRLVRKPVVELNPHSAPEAEVHNPEKRQALWKIAAVLVPVGLAGMMLLGSQMKQDAFHFANLSPFGSKKSEMLPLAAPAVIPTFKENEASSFDSALQGVGSAPFIRYNFTENTPSENGVKVKLKENAVAPADRQNRSADGLYEIVGGAFMFEENADKYVSQLRRKGYGALRSGTHRGLFVVAIGRYQSQTEADQALQTIRKKENQNAWVRRR